MPVIMACSRRTSQSS